MLISKNDITIIITTYRRFSHLREIALAWSKQCPNIIIANGGEKILNFRFPQYIFSPDPGNKIRFAAAHLSMTPYVLLADDDVMPLPGLLDDFIKSYQKSNADIAGIIGRNFIKDNYFECPFIRSSKVDKPMKVDFCGILYFCHRSMIEFDLSGLDHRAYDDLYWQCAMKRSAKKIVIQSKNYKNILALCNDKESIFKTPESKAKRQEFYSKIRRHYVKG